jgi:hypothetical protein
MRASRVILVRGPSTYDERAIGTSLYPTVGSSIATLSVRVRPNPSIVRTKPSRLTVPMYLTFGPRCSSSAPVAGSLRITTM